MGKKRYFPYVVFYLTWNCVAVLFLDKVPKRIQQIKFPLIWNKYQKNDQLRFMLILNRDPMFCRYFTLLNDSVILNRSATVNTGVWEYDQSQFKLSFL